MAPHPKNPNLFSFKSLIFSLSFFIIFPLSPFAVHFFSIAPGETKRKSAYYTNGQPARQTDALGNTTKYEYGYLNKLTKTYIPFSGKEKYSITENEYDKNGNIVLTRQTVQKQDSDKIQYSITQNKYNAMGCWNR